jgi:hypothetical protein
MAGCDTLQTNISLHSDERNNPQRDFSPFSAGLQRVGLFNNNNLTISDVFNSQQ